MAALALTELDHAPDADLWQLVRQGNVPAFETLVRRHQSVVCAVAYNACGDFALSEDVAQETFWAAWRDRAALMDPGRLRAWLCGIARNLGNNARRRETRPTGPAAPLEAAADVSAATPDPGAAAVTREEESLVWQTLEQIPESLREPLILFYREQQSVAEVAAALDLSPDAVKQRLSRGRGLLRDRMAEVVEGALRRSRPGRTFTVAVMTGLTAASISSQTALAGTGTVATGAALKAAAGAGLWGGLLGSVMGLAGGWLGAWLPAQVAPSQRERDYLRRTSRRMLSVSVLFTLALVAPVLLAEGQFSFVPYLIFWATWMVAYQTYVIVESVRSARMVKRLRAEPLTDPNDAPLRVGLTALTVRYRGRVFRSRATFLGLPLLDVNVSDPAPACPAGQQSERHVARGWVAIGDDARGILLAIGGTARGLVAVGGRTLGVLSIGGLAMGLVAVGGLALGGLAIGGLGIGVIGLGGLGIGWQAAGGGALAWDTACGGGAVAWHAAFGGAAIAHEYAVGGEALAIHANDEAAKAVLLDHPLKQGMDGYAANSTWPVIAIVAFALLMSCLMLPLMYRRDSVGQEDAQQSLGH
jgi:zinc protease